MASRTAIARLAAFSYALLSFGSLLLSAKFSQTLGEIVSKERPKPHQAEVVKIERPDRFLIVQKNEFGSQGTDKSKKKSRPTNTKAP